MQKNTAFPPICFFTVFIISFFLFAKCDKPKEEDLGDYYIRCKIDGEPYRPNGCTNCMKGQILRDTVFLMNANAGFKSVCMGFFDGQGVRVKAYIFDGIKAAASYKFSTSTDDIYRTDSLRSRVLNITALDKTNKIVAGTFHFQAYNPVQNKTVSVTEGKFRLKYDTY